MTSEPRPRSAQHVALLYAPFGSVGILGADTLLGWIERDPDWIVKLNATKGWAFVVVTAALLYPLLTWHERRALAQPASREALQSERLQALALVQAIADGSSDAISAEAP